MALIIPTCIKCQAEIKEDEEVFVKLTYPKRKGFTEVKAYLSLDGKFICSKCSAKMTFK